MNKNNLIIDHPVSVKFISLGKKYKSTSVLDDHLPVHFKKKEGKKEDSKRKLKRAPATDFTCKMCSEV